MKENLGDRDSKIRIGAGAVLVGLGALTQSGTIPLLSFLPGLITPTFLSILGLVLVVEGYFSRCMLYRILNISTKKSE